MEISKRRSKGGSRMNVDHHQTKGDRIYFKQDDNTQISHKGKGDISMTESQLVDFFGVNIEETQLLIATTPQNIFPIS
jgi:hypothetical protein